MPVTARELHDEARAVLPHSLRAAAALARASLEHLLREIVDNPKGLDLNSLINSLIGRVSDPLWKMMVSVRVIGNLALHRAGNEETAILLLSDDSVETVVHLLEATNLVFEELVETKEIADRIFASLPPHQREAAETAFVKKRSIEPS